MECLITNKVCSVKKCKHCKLEDCKEVLQMIEEQEKWEDRRAMKKLQRDLPEECKKCTIKQIINVRKEQVYCPYRIKERCILK